MCEQESRFVPARFDEAMRPAEQAFLDELPKRLSNLGERLYGDMDSEPKVFRETALTKLSQFIQPIRVKSIHSNGQRDDLLQRAQSQHHVVKLGGRRLERDPGPLCTHVLDWKSQRAMPCLAAATPEVRLIKADHHPRTGWFVMP